MIEFGVCRRQGDELYPRAFSFRIPFFVPIRSPTQNNKNKSQQLYKYKIKNKYTRANEPNKI